MLECHFCYSLCSLGGKEGGLCNNLTPGYSGKYIFIMRFNLTDWEHISY